MKFRGFGGCWEGGVFLWVLSKVLVEAVVLDRWSSLTAKDPYSFGLLRLPRLQNVMLSTKSRNATVNAAKGDRPLKKLLIAGLFLGAATWMTPEVRGQGCDTLGCKCQNGHHGHHGDCKALTVLDRIDSIADRLETGLDRVFGKVLPKKKKCNCAHCRGTSGVAVHENAPTDSAPLVDPGVDPIPMPEEPGIADPLPILTIEPNGRSNGTPPVSPNSSARPRVPLKTTESNREFPTSTDGIRGIPLNIGPKQPAVELRPFEKAPSSGKSPRESGSNPPEWQVDPFKEDQSNKQIPKPQRLLPQPTEPANDIRWSKRPTAEQQSQKMEDTKARIIAANQSAVAPKVEQKTQSEPVLRFRIGDKPVEKASGEVSDRDDSPVVKASSNQPIRITFPVKK